MFIKLDTAPSDQTFTGELKDSSTHFSELITPTSPQHSAKGRQCEYFWISRGKDFTLGYGSFPLVFIIYDQAKKNSYI